MISLLINDWKHAMEKYHPPIKRASTEKKKLHLSTT